MWLTGKVTEFGNPQSIPISFLYYKYKYTTFLKKMSTVTDLERSRRLRLYFKFIFVREPIERLVSGYRDKVLLTEYFRAQVSEKLKQYMRAGVSINRTERMSKILSTKSKPTFSDFVSFILDERDAGELLDTHWRPQNEACHPCIFGFDFIGHYDTLETDAEYIIHLLRNRAPEAEKKHVSTFRFPSDKRTKTSSANRDIFFAMWSQLSPDDQRRLIEVYQADYRMFGFPKPAIKD